MAPFVLMNSVELGFESLIPWCTVKDIDLKDFTLTSLNISEFLPRTKQFIHLSITNQFISAVEGVTLGTTAIISSGGDNKLSFPLPDISQFINQMKELSLPSTAEDISTYYYQHFEQYQSHANNKLDRFLISKALLDLLRCNINFTHRDVILKYLPETMIYDSKHLLTMKNQIDLIALVATLTITTRQYILNVKGFKSSAYSMKYEENNLLSLLNIQLNDAKVTFSQIKECVKDYIRNVISLFVTSSGNCGTSLSPGSFVTISNSSTISRGDSRMLLSDTWEQEVDLIIQKCLGRDSPILKLFVSRVHKVIIRAVCDIPYIDMLPSLSMNTKIQVISITLL